MQNVRGKTVVKRLTIKHDNNDVFEPDGNCEELLNSQILKTNFHIAHFTIVATFETIIRYLNSNKIKYETLEKLQKTDYDIHLNNHASKYEECNANIETTTDFSESEVSRIYEELWTQSIN